MLFLLMNHIVMQIYTKHGQEIKMPDVTGLSFEEAELLINDSFN